MTLGKRVSSSDVWFVLTASIKSKINLRMTLCGGQCFHWHPTPRNTFVGAIGHQVYELREVYCPAKTRQLSGGRISTAASMSRPAQKVKTTVDVPEDVCCWVEYRRLCPPPTAVQEELELAAGSRRTSITTTSSRPKHVLVKETDEQLLTRYLSLDVNLAALWLRWTAASTTRQHPLVTYLIGNSNDTTVAEAAKTSIHQRKTLSPLCVHDGGVDTMSYIPIRHVCQDVHSCLFSFLCSQNNNVSRITTMIYSLCRRYGDHLCDVQLATGAVRPPSMGTAKHGAKSCTTQSSKWVSAAESAVSQVWPPSRVSDSKKTAPACEWLGLYCFPSVKQLAAASEDELRNLGFGYRSKYVVEAAQSIAMPPALYTSVAQLVAAIPTPLRRQHQVCIQEPFYADLLAHHGDLAYQREKLLGLCGVGRKVADCVLLFSLSHSNLVPVDTHMAQIAVEYLATPTPTSTSTTTTTLAQRQPPRKRRRSCEKSEQPTTAGAVEKTVSAWQEELRLWGEKAKQLQLESAKQAVSQKRMKSVKPGAKRGGGLLRSVLGTEVEAARGTKLPVPPLYERHHDAIQHGFTELFGSHAGWAHSILFYYHMRRQRGSSPLLPLH
jgi:N-glycosylase/DNA lyase